MNFRSYEIVTWHDIKSQIKITNSELFHAIESIHPGTNLKLIRAKYSFGDLILNNGSLNLPIEGTLLPITDLKLPEQLKHQLNYSKIPLFLVLKKSVEVYVNTDTRTIPLNLFKTGSLLGLFECLDAMFNVTSNPRWSVSAGARNILMLPKIAESQGVRRLRFAYNLPLNTTLNSFDQHWEVLTAIANYPKLNSNWHTEIVLFTKDWFNKKTDPAWQPFYDYLYGMAWKQSQFAIGKIELSLNWEAFADAIAARRLKPPPYLADQTKHILSIAAGRWPAFRPAVDEETAPIYALQQAFIETYQLKKYIPTLMHIHLPIPGEKIPVYYSLYYPTLLEGTPNKQIASTIMLDLRNIKLLLNTLEKDHTLTTRLENSNIYHNTFNFFHVEKDRYKDINPCELISKEDFSFYINTERFPDRVFCNTSPFWRGCIRITV